MANKSMPLGFLNKALSNFQCLNFPQLNASSQNFGEGGMKMSFDGPATKRVGALTGDIPSLELYQPVSIMVPMLKTQAAGASWQAQVQNNSNIGDCIVYPDATTINPWTIINCSITDQDPGSLDGSDARYIFKVAGYYPVNSSAFG